jgi:putative lumazine-binding protein
MATTVTDERTAIETTVGLYIDGASKGDAAKLKQAFHEKGWMFGNVAGDRFDAPFTTMIQELTANPLDSDGGYRGRIVGVEQTGDGAVVTVEESGCWGNLSFIDYFTLAKIDGVWKIVNKVFVRSPAAWSGRGESREEHHGGTERHDGAEPPEPYVRRMLPPFPVLSP